VMEQQRRQPWARLEYWAKIGGAKMPHGLEPPDDPKDAALAIQEKIQACLKDHIPWLLVYVRPEGEVGAIPDTLVEVRVDRQQGSTKKDLDAVLAALVYPTPPNVLVRVLFTQDGDLVEARGAQVHLSLEVRSYGPTLAVARERHERTSALKHEAASKCAAQPEGPVYETVKEAYEASAEGLNMCLNCFHPHAR
jgi:hypothetical protein